MSTEITGLVGIAVLLIVIFCRMGVGLAMAFVGSLGYFYLEGGRNTLAMLGIVPYNCIAFYSLSAIPLFILMGNIISETGVGKNLYDAAYRWTGHMKGGLAMATVIACACFAAISGSSIAGAVTMSRVALPEMRKYKYDNSLSSACVAAGGTLGILIPPSLGFIIYGILTEQSIGKLFMAGILPGILLTSLFILAIVIIAARRPMAGPPGPKVSFKEKIVSLKKIWATVTIFLSILGGIYAGVFTPTEAGAIGAFCAIIVALISRRLSWKSMIEALYHTGHATAMIVLLIIGAFIFMRFLTISGLTSMMADTVSNLNIPRYVIFALIIFFYLVAGMFLEIMSAMVLTIPIIFPVIQELRFDPIWFGVIVVILMEMGTITPPIGLNVLTLAGVTDIPLDVIFRGVWPFVIAMLLIVIILTFFPQIALFIPAKI